MIKNLTQSSLTNDIKYRSMSVGNLPSSEYLIQSYILDTATAVVEFDVTGLGSQFRHLQLIYSARSTHNGSLEAIFLRFNGVQTASYSRHRMRGDGSGINSAANVSQTSILGVGVLAGATIGTNIFAAGIIDILDPFSTNKNTTTRTLDGQVGASNWIGLESGAFYSTAAITSITLFSQNSANFVAGSRFSLYGVTA
jgi:hypothetical protein